MLKHGRAGVPMEVMGLMLGEFIDEYTVEVVDVFAMPQSGTGVSVEAVDHVFQTDMLEMLRQTNRPQMVVGWYHSHPGFGCWLSSVDVNTQQSFEQLNARSVAVVVDPIQSVKGKVVMDAFRLIDQQLLVTGNPHRQTTSNLGNLRKPSLQALMHNLNRHYYSINVDSRRNPLEEQMLLSLHKESWSAVLKLEDWEAEEKKMVALLDQMTSHAKEYQKRIAAEEGKSTLELLVENTGKVDPKKNLEESVDVILQDNLSQMLGSMLDAVAF
jgi:26S proteasome regulatory subunit N11